jgi:hypothetical protein
MKQIRYGVFETNSSSTHSLTICSDEEYEKFVSGEMLFDRIEETLVPIAPELFEDDKSWQFETYKVYTSPDELEHFHGEYETKSGDKIHVFGKFGYDG